MQENDRRFRILVIEDDASCRKSLVGFLQNRGYVVEAAESAAGGLALLDESQFQLVIAAVSLRHLGEQDLLDLSRKDQHPFDVIFVTGYLDLGFAIQGMHDGAYDFFHKPLNFEKIAFTVNRLNEHLEVRIGSQKLINGKIERQLQQETALSLARAAEGRDRLNIGHGRRVAAYAVRLGRALCFSDDRLAQLELASKLHDIGKIGIDDAILNKTGSLSDPEFVQMKRHSEIGEYIVKPVSFFKEIVPAVRWHHERWDGRGYPDGLVGDDIPIDARIVAICDFFDAVTSKRPYRNPATLSEALGMIEEERGKYFDPVLVDVFISLYERQREIVA